MDPLTRLRPERRTTVDQFAGLVDRPSHRRAEDTSSPTATVEPLADLIRLTERLTEVGRTTEPVAAPSAEFRGALRTRLLAVAAVQGVGRATTTPPAVPGTSPQSASWRTSRRGQRTLGVVAGSLASLVAVGGVAAAGAQSLPGDPFYGVKRTAEAVQLATSSSDLAKGQRHLQFAENRLDEVQELSRQQTGTSGDPDLDRRITLGFDDMDAEVREGTDLLTSAFRRAQGRGRTAEEQAPLRALSRFAAANSVTLQRLIDQLPPTSRARAAASLALVAGVGADAEELLRLGTCGPACRAAAPSPGGAAAGPCDCATSSEPGAGVGVDGAPDGTAPAGPGAPDPGAPGPALTDPVTGPGSGSGAADPGAPAQSPAAPGTPPGGTLPGGTPPGGTLPGGTLPGGTLPGGTPPGGTLPGGTLPGGTPPASGGGPVLPVPLPGVPVLPPGPGPTGSTPPTLAPTQPVELPTLAPPPLPVPLPSELAPGGIPLPR